VLPDARTRTCRKRLRVALLLAGDRALQLDVQAAEGYFRQAVDAGRRPLDRAGAGAGQGRVGARVPGRGAEATAIYAEAIPVLLETDEITAGEALRRLSSTAWALGDADAVPGECTRGDRGADAASGPALVRAYGTAALNEAIAGRVQEAETLYDTGFEEAARLGIEDVGVLLHARASVRGYQATRAVSKARA
jgi:hypothetical protein